MSSVYHFYKKSVILNIFKRVMPKKLIILFFCLVPLFEYAQDFSELWTGHYSFNNVSQVVEGNNTIFAASGNAIFTIDLETDTINQISTVNGLSGELITTIAYSETFELLMIGYQNGFIDIVFDNSTDVQPVIDISNRTNVATGSRAINHFNIDNDLVYISTDFGISVFDIERLEFGDTFIIGDAGAEIPITQTTIFEGFIYASSTNNNGVRRGDLSNPNLIDFNNWDEVVAGSYSAVQANENNLYALGTNRRLYDITLGNLNQVETFNTQPLELSAHLGNLLVTTRNTSFVYDSNFSLISQVEVSEEFDTNFSSTTFIENIGQYIGTSDFGILNQSPTSDTFEELRPDGPILNTPFCIEAEQGEVWVSYGEYTFDLNPFPLNSRGISLLREGSWINTPFSEVLGARELNGISINPLNRSQVFISSYFDGLLELNNDVPTVLYDQTNSDLRPLVLPNNPTAVTNDIRVGKTAFDENGLLWTITNLVEEPLRSYNPETNTWVSYDLSEVIAQPFDNLGFTQIEIDPVTNTKFITSFSRGVIGFNENSPIPQITHIDEEDNLPVNAVRSIAVDRQNQLWIGTVEGLRVVFNASSFFDDNVTAEPIIIEEDGVARELLFEQFVSDIEVDGSNNKWVSTIGSGVFLFSADAQETIFHFTTSNSPLPSNNVNDISIDSNNGIVYMASDRGLVSFRAGGSDPVEDFSTARAYPNPVRPGFNIVEEKVKITDLPENVNIKIVDIEGNLITEAQSGITQRFSGFNLEIDGGTAFWNGKNSANNVVASGVYLILLADLDTLETNVVKLLVVR